MSKEIYIPATKSLFTCSQVVNKTSGEVIKLTNDHKMIYFWCKDQYDFFNSKNQKYFASWEEILKQVGGMTYERKIKRVIKELSEIGLVTVEGSKKSNHKIVKRVDEITEWLFENPENDAYKAPEAIEERKAAKVERFNNWETKKKEDNSWVDHSKKPYTPPQQPKPTYKEPEEYDPFDDPFDPFMNDIPF